MGSSKANTGGLKTYDYYGTIAAAICEGPVAGLHAVIIDNKEVWPKATAWAAGQNVTVNHLRACNGQTWKALSSHATTTENAPPNATYWELYKLAASGDYSSLTISGYGTARIYWGTQSQTVDPLLASAGNEKGEQHPDYKGICYLVLVDFLLGRERTTAPNLEVVVSRAPSQNIVTDGGGNTPAILVDGQANLVAAACEILTSANGLGQSASLLDSPSLNEAADDADDRDDITAASLLFDSQLGLKEFTDLMQDMLDVVLRFNQLTGLIEAKAYVHGSAPLSFTTLVIDDLVEPPQFSAEGWSSMKTGAVVVFHDRQRGFKETSEKVDDLRAFTVLGEHRRVTLNRPDITRREQAIAHAMETLRAVGRPQLTGEIVVRREKGKSIRAGDWVKLDIELEPGGAQLLQFFRVQRRELPYTGPIRLNLVADTTLSPIPYAPSEPLSPPVDITVAAVANYRIVEAPAETIDAEDRLLALVERPAQLTSGANVYFDTAEGGDYQLLASVANFAARATIRADLTDAATTILVAAPYQVDRARFEEEPGAVQAADDTLLAFLVKITAGQVATDGSGFSFLECCSISAQALVSATAWSSGVAVAAGDVHSHGDVTYRCIDAHTTGASTEPGVGADWADYWAVSPYNYDLTVLRGRRGTVGRAFDAVDTEIWVVPRSLMVEFTHKDFPTLRAGADPAYFKLQPFTYLDTRDIDDCTAGDFTFAPEVPKRPTLTLTDPGSLSVSVSNPWPVDVDVVGTWNDENGDMISVRTALRDATTSHTIYEEVFSPTGTKAIDQSISIPGAGTWYIDLIATDISGLETTKTITVTATGSSPKLPKPMIYWANLTYRNMDGAEHNIMSGFYEIWSQIPGVTKWYRQKASGTWGSWIQQDYLMLTSDISAALYAYQFKVSKDGYTDSDSASMGII
jgi:hypothetical protein